MTRWKREWEVCKKKKKRKWASVCSVFIPLYSMAVVILMSRQHQTGLWALINVGIVRRRVRVRKVSVREKRVSVGECMWVSSNKKG